LFGGLSQDYQARAGDAYKSTLLNSAMGLNAGRPSVLSPNLFADAKERGGIWALQRAMQQEEKAENAKAKLEETLTKAAIENPRQYRRNLPVLQELLFGQTPPENKPMAEPLDPQGSKAITAADRMEQLLDETGGDESLAESLYLEEIKSKKDEDKSAKQSIKELEKETYNRITNSPTYKQFIDISANFRTLASLSDNEEAATSPAMITAFGRILDPGATVREGEYETINKNTQSLLDSIAGNWRQAFRGKAALSAQARQDLVRIASEKYNMFGAQFGLERARLMEALLKQGGSKDNVPVTNFNPYRDPQLTKEGLIASLKRQGVDKDTAKYLFEAMFGGSNGG